jgi:integrase-like protein
MANIAKRADGHWRARYRDAHGKKHARHFNRKIDAQNWLDSVTTACRPASTSTPIAARSPTRDWSARWLDGQAAESGSGDQLAAGRRHRAPISHARAVDGFRCDDGAQGSSRVFTHGQDGRQGWSTGHERYAGILREHVLPQWSAVQLIDVTHADVQAWVSRLAARRSPATVRKVHRVFSLIVKTAVRDGRLARNPAAEINLPRVVATERRYLTHEQVHALAQALAKPCGSQ